MADPAQPDGCSHQRIIGLRIETYCVMCRKGLPPCRDKGKIGAPLQHPCTESWETDVIAFFNTSESVDDGPYPAAPPSVYAFRTSLETETWPPYQPTDARGNMRPVMVLRRKNEYGGQNMNDSIGVTFPKRISEDETHASPYRVLFFVHKACWRVARQVQEHPTHGRQPKSTRWTLELLYRLADQTRQIVPRGCSDGDVNVEYKAALTAILPLSFTLADDDDDPEAPALLTEKLAPAEADAMAQLSASMATLTTLLQKTLLLPVELHAHIAEHTDGGQMGSLLRSIETASVFRGVRRPWVERSRATREYPRVQNVLPLTIPKEETSECLFFLMARSVRLFGVDYLHDIQFVKTTKDGLEKQERRLRARRRDGTANVVGNGSPWAGKIQLRGGQRVNGLRVWIGTLGVAALQLFYVDGHFSPVLGRIPMQMNSRCTVQEKVFTDDQTTLQSFRDDGVSNIGCEADKLHIVDTEMFPSSPLHYHGRRALSFVPLQLHVGSEMHWPTGLTTFCLPRGGVCGATVHYGGDGVRSSACRFHTGCHCGIPVHLALLPGEYITFVGLKVNNDISHHRAVTGPSIVIMTTIRRSFLFGPHHPSLDGTMSAPVTDVEHDDMPVLKLFFDRMTVDGCSWRSIGAQSMAPHYVSELGDDGDNNQNDNDDDDDQEQNQDQDPNPVSPPPLPLGCVLPAPRFIPDLDDGMDRFRQTAFFSHLYLAEGVEDDGETNEQGEDSELVEDGEDGIAALQVCRRGERCIGLAVHHTADRPVTILGSWLPEADSSQGPISAPRTTVEELDLHGTSFPTINFAFSVDGKTVNNISVLSDKAPSQDVAVGPHDIVADTKIAKHIVWWFNDQRDLVESWYPDFMEVMFPEPGLPSLYQPKQLSANDSELIAADE